MEEVTGFYGLDCMLYANYTQHHIQFNSVNRNVEISKREACCNDIMIWCTANGLACNAGKTEVTIYLVDMPENIIRFLERISEALLYRSHKLHVICDSLMIITCS